MIVISVALGLLVCSQIAVLIALHRYRAGERGRISGAVREALIAINRDPEYWHDEREVTGTISAEQHDDRRWWLEPNLLVRKHRQKPPD